MPYAKCKHCGMIHYYSSTKGFRLSDERCDNCEGDLGRVKFDDVQNRDELWVAREQHYLNPPYPRRRR